MKKIVPAMKISGRNTDDESCATAVSTAYRRAYAAASVTTSTARSGTTTGSPSDGTASDGFATLLWAGAPTASKTPDGRLWFVARNGIIVVSPGRVREVPPERWDADAFYDASGETPGKMSVRWAAFIDGVTVLSNKP